MSFGSIDRMHPRSTITRLLLDGNIAAVLEMAGVLHGHYCPGVALGVKAVDVLVRRLAITDNTGMEEVMAVVECNNCFVDGVQIASGCSLGNNSLVYRDLGKTALTLYRRGDTKAMRCCVKSFDVDAGSSTEKAEGDALFEKAVKRREKLSEAESGRMKELWIQRSFATIAMDDDALFTISPLDAPSIPFAPILDLQVCSTCGEKVMESKILLRSAKALCLDCAGEEYRLVIGKGISTARTRRT